MRTYLLPLLLLATQAFAQAPLQLEGLRYRGTAEVQWQEGCEGCGNAGHVYFLKGRHVDYLLPGSDTPNRLRFTREGNRVLLEDTSLRMELQGDSLFLTAYGYRHAFVRERD
ncbi:MAG: hypothetical protein KF905_05000 [Flavobacteriales bacterium]|nr:hypothetical protein [Flavobacteriales bacterium]